MLKIITPAATSDLTVLGSVKAELGIEDTSQDQLLTTYIRQASDLLTRECGRDTFGRQVLQQIERSQTAIPYIILARDINVQITSVLEGSTLLDASDYELDGSLLRRLDTAGLYSNFYSGVVTVNYSAGYELVTDLPYDIEQACIELVKRSFAAKGRSSDIKTDVQEGIGSISYFAGNPAALPDEIKEVIANHKLWVFV